MKTLQRTEHQSPHLTDANGECISIAGLAERWDTTEQAIYAQRHRKQPLPPFFKRGRKLLTTLAAVEKFEATGMAEDLQAQTADDTEAA